MRILLGRAAFLLATCAACSDGPSSPSGSSATTSTTAATTTTTAPASQVLRQATLGNANGYMTEGSVQIVRAGSEFTLELLPDFRTSQSPALDVRLCRDPNCRQDNLNLGDLMAFSGAQSYRLPDDAASFSHAVIYCRAVRLAFGFGVLR